MIYKIGHLTVGVASSIEQLESEPLEPNANESRGISNAVILMVCKALKMQTDAMSSCNSFCAAAVWTSARRFEVY
jgi:hypothetical protein